MVKVILGKKQEQNKKYFWLIASWKIWKKRISLNESNMYEIYLSHTLYDTRINKIK